MIRIQVLKQYKSIQQLNIFELPDFTVLTGKNGSGKSHLMELMSHNDSEFKTIEVDGVVSKKVKYIGFNGLNPVVSDVGGYEYITHKRKEIWNTLKKIIDEYQSELSNHRCSSVDDYIHRYYSARNSVFPYWYEKTGRNLEKLTEGFVYKNYHLTNEDVFNSQFASIFKLYHLVYEDNQFAAYRNERYHEQNEVLSEPEFEQLYGPKPWILINDMLRRAGLTYEVNNPIGIKREEDFILKLRDVNTGIEIKVADLSTGEKVLMSLALAIYNTRENEVKPDILLLDEPDAALHPVFSKVLLEAIQESIVKQAGVKVMISTHSPSTVALAPEESIYMMNKSLNIPEKVTRNRAVGILTQDLTAFHISLDNRRQVFVESPYDVEYYTKIFNLLNVGLGVMPMFLEPHSHNGTNCTDVIDIVKDLRLKGNDMVYGIIDYDNKNDDDTFTFVLGKGKRYAIDNYVFDPIYVAFLLVSEKIATTDDMGGGSHKFVDLGNASDTEIQCMIDYVASQLSMTSTTMVDYDVQCGKSFHVPEDYFTTQGHELEDRIKNKWPALKAIAKNKDNLLKNFVLDRIADAYPQFISVDFIELFSKIK